MAALLFKRLALVPERSQLVVEHAQRGDDSHAHVDFEARSPRKPNHSWAALFYY